MAATRTNTSLFSGQTTTATSSNADVSASYLREVLVKIVVVGTATTGASFSFNYSADGTNYTYASDTYTAPTAAGTYNWRITLPGGFKKFNMAFTQQSGGTSSTCTADLTEVTAL
jgi:hypothetical protein